MNARSVCYMGLGAAIAITSSVAQVTTSQYDNFRTGAVLTERILTPQNVNARQFGKLGAFKVDGAVYAQPLFLPSVEIPGKASAMFCSSPRNTIASMLSMLFGLMTHHCGTLVFWTRSAILSPCLREMCNALSFSPKLVSLQRLSST